MTDELQTNGCSTALEETATLAHHNRGEHEPERVDESGLQE